MSSHLGSYDFDKRWKEVKKELKNEMNIEKVMKVLSDSNEENYTGVYRFNSNSDFKSTLLRNINEKIDQLDIDVDGLKTDGHEKRFLKTNADCDKLFKELDSMEGLSEESKIERLESYRRVKELDQKLNSKAIENLENGVTDLFGTKEPNDCEDPKISEISDIISGKKTATLQQIDDYRSYLEKLNKK